MRDLEVFKSMVKNTTKEHLQFTQTIKTEDKDMSEKMINSINILKNDGYIEVSSMETREIGNKLVTLLNGKVTDKGIKYIEDNNIETYK